jgi:nuclear GTP-binding protein
MARLRNDKQYISVGLVGYPNVGKSSVINTLRSKKVCNVAPIPGCTKVWQYITLMKRIFLIDCPGVVYSGAGDTDTDAVLKGVVRVESLEDATEHIPEVLRRVKPEYLRRAYRLASWQDADDFLEQVARGAGKLGKGGEPDLNTAAKMVLHDWQRGKVPFFTLPADYEEVAPGAALALLPAGVVTEEDAAAGPEGDPEAAARAAKALAAEAVAATAKQRRSAIPVQAGFYNPDDEDGGEDDKEDASSEEEVEDSEGEEGSEGKEDGSDDERGSGGSDDEEGSSESEDDDDDGYGDQGLSWEAVMATMKGSGGNGEAAAAVKEEEEEEEEEEEAPAKKRRKKQQPRK